MAIVGGTVTTAARSAGHYVSFGVTFIMLVVMIIFTANSTKRRYGSKWKKYGPLIFVSLAFPLIMADLTRHVFQDVDWWPPPGSSEYRHGCQTENVTCLSVVGWMFTIVMTYLGFTFLVIGTLWNANIIEKLNECVIKWRELRSNPVEVTYTKVT